MTLEIVDEKNSVWYVHFNGPAGSLYEDEPFTLKFKYSENYPFEPPEVQFVGTPPVHEHVYSCGFICLSTLDSDWTPALTTSNVCLSIMSMMASASEKKAPPNNAEASRSMKGKTPR